MGLVPVVGLVPRIQTGLKPWNYDWRDWTKRGVMGLFRSIKVNKMSPVLHKHLLGRELSFSVVSATEKQLILHNRQLLLFTWRQLAICPGRPLNPSVFHSFWSGRQLSQCFLSCWFILVRKEVTTVFSHFVRLQISQFFFSLFAGLEASAWFSKSLLVWIRNTSESPVRREKNVIFRVSLQSLFHPFCSTSARIVLAFLTAK